MPDPHQRGWAHVRGGTDFLFAVAQTLALCGSMLQAVIGHASHCNARVCTRLAGQEPINPESSVVNSKQIGGLVGPVLGVMLLAEFPLVQPALYDAQIPPVIYLSGVLLFVAGLAVVRAHNAWAWNWTVLITLSGWSCLALGLVRMFAASRYRQATQGGSPMNWMILEGLLLVVALTITFKAYDNRAP